MEIKMVNFGHADRELATHVGDEWPQHRTLVFQRMHLTEPQVELDHAHPHRHLAERTRHRLGCERPKVGDRAAAPLPPASGTWIRRGDPKL